MQKKVKIEIAVLAVLIIIFGISFWVGQGINSTAKIDCNTLCFQAGNNWLFPGAGNGNIFPTQDDCISACQTRFKK